MRKVFIKMIGIDLAVIFHKNQDQFPAKYSINPVVISDRDLTTWSASPSSRDMAEEFW